MGDNNHGQLGDGTYNITNQPEEIVASNVTTIAAGLYHSLFLKNDGSLWAMGWNIGTASWVMAPITIPTGPSRL
jgi:alpha-tubulin suppressor-like RCC1 family protein